jgi:hypothetical protein
MSSHVYTIADQVAFLLVAEHCSYFAISRVEAKGVLQPCLFRSWGLGAHCADGRVFLRPCEGENKQSKHHAKIHYEPSIEEENEAVRVGEQLQPWAPFLTETTEKSTRYLSLEPRPRGFTGCVRGFLG